MTRTSRCAACARVRVCAVSRYFFAGRMDAPRPQVGATKTPARDAIGMMTNRMIAMAVEELRREETQLRIRSHLVDPLIKIMSQQMMPYVLVLFALVSAILLTTLMTFAMFAMSFFGSGTGRGARRALLLT